MDSVIYRYGCQMNVSDTELVRTILTGAGFALTEDVSKAEVVLLNTCAIREAAEQKVWGKVRALQQQPSTYKPAGKRTIGILGCMAERLKEKLLDSSLVQVVAGVSLCLPAQSFCQQQLQIQSM
jgi:tRNA-2-methylthio-N6-dimethylallyladenosine synthase